MQVCLTCMSLRPKLQTHNRSRYPCKRRPCRHRMFAMRYGTRVGEVGDAGTCRHSVWVGRQAGRPMSQASTAVRQRCDALHYTACCKLPLSSSCDRSEVHRAYQPWEVLIWLQQWADPSCATSACWRLNQPQMSAAPMLVVIVVRNGIHGELWRCKCGALYLHDDCRSFRCCKEALPACRPRRC